MDYIEFDDIFIKVDEIYTSGLPGYVCKQCGKSFLILKTDPSTKDFNILYNDKYEVSDYGCDIHINFDLLMDPTFGMVVLMPKSLPGATIVVAKPEYAFTFLHNRLN